MAQPVPLSRLAKKMIKEVAKIHTADGKMYYALIGTRGKILARFDFEAFFDSAGNRFLDDATEEEEVCD